MAEITNAVLAEKIDNLYNAMTEIKTDVNTVKKDIKCNTEFRLKANGVIALVGIIATFIGGIITAIVAKVWR